QVLTAGQGQNPARQAAMAAGIPKEVPSWSLNQVCGSGLRAVALASQAIALGDSKIVIAGGQESMSMSPHCQALRQGAKMGDVSLIDTMIKDGLTDVFNGYHMGITAENLAEKYEISREAQDEVAVRSQDRAAAAIASGKFKDEIVPVQVKSGKEMVTIDQDEHPRQTSMEALGKLKAAFKDGGMVTAGNASGINDGAAALLVTSASKAKELGWKPRLRMVARAEAGVEPSIMGAGPIPAVQRALKKANMTLDQIDLIELNEAFAAQVLACMKELPIDPEKLNVNGGAIALGHPLGCTGAKLTTTLLYEMKRRNARYGLVTMCVGGGMGAAGIFERI
ncbi:MAG: acetyl-CoA C-acetyltransferase, partial [Sphingomicrobium sp.]